MLPESLVITGPVAWRHRVDPDVSAFEATFEGRPARVYQRLGDVDDPGMVRSRVASRRARGEGWQPVLSADADADRPWLVLDRPEGMDLHGWFEACIIDPGAPNAPLAVHVVAAVARALAPCYADGTALPGGRVQDAVILRDGTVLLGAGGALTTMSTPPEVEQVRHLFDLLRHLAGSTRPRAIDVLGADIGSQTLVGLADALATIGSRVDELRFWRTGLEDVRKALVSHRPLTDPDPSSLEPGSDTIPDTASGDVTLAERSDIQHPDRPPDTLSLSLEETSLQEAVVGGRYRLLRMIGSGSMGNVYEAERLADGEHVAVKVMKPEADEGPSRDDYVARFRREADLLARLHHPHIVEVHAFGTRGACWMAMELVHGHSLVELLDPGEPLPLQLALAITQQVARALVHAHEQGIVHRDVKPGNLLVASHDPIHVKLCDFGLAKAWDDEDRTVQGALIGTPQYMSPEQARGEPAGVRADLYGTGILLYRLVTGRTPFADHPGASVLLAHANQDPIPMAEANPKVEVPRIVQDVVDRCLAKTPGERYGSAEWLVADLDRCMERIAQPSDPTPALSVPYREVTSEEALDPLILASVPPPRPKPPRGVDDRVLVGAIGAVSVLVLVGVAGLGWWLYDHEIRPEPAPETAPATP